MRDIDLERITAHGLDPKDFEPRAEQTTIPELEAALVEVAETAANNEISLEELTQAVLELAEIIGG